MRRLTAAIFGTGFIVLSAFAPAFGATPAQEILVAKIQKAHKLTDAQAAALRSVMEHSPYAPGLIGQEPPGAPNLHPVTDAQCRSEVLDKGLLKPNPKFEAICGAPNMAPIPEGRTGRIDSSPVCIDQFEYPNIPCEYPVVWVNGHEAAQMCEAEGKRLCDVAEWEGGCAGWMQDDKDAYAFDQVPEEDRSSMNPRTFAPQVPGPGIHMNMRREINRKREVLWAYGKERRGDICAFGVPKSPGCDEAIANASLVKYVPQRCGANTYPSGYDYQCKSDLDVYDQHGNVSELSNYPMTPQEMTVHGGHGFTEMKGSWFVFPKSATEKVHDDDCRWRAPSWHMTALMDPHGVKDYMMGFRCCKSLSK